jgi:ATP-dependent Zn protease
VARILSEALSRARALLAEHRGALLGIAVRLLEVETMSGDDVRAVMDRAERC